MLFKEHAFLVPIHPRVIASPNKHVKHQILFLYHPVWNYGSYFTYPSINAIIAEKQEELLYSVMEYTDFIQRLPLLW